MNEVCNDIKYVMFKGFREQFMKKMINDWSSGGDSVYARINSFTLPYGTRGIDGLLSMDKWE